MSPMPMTPSSSPAGGPPVRIWWILWVAILAGLLVIGVALRSPAPPVPEPQANPMFNLVGMVPLFLSIVLRWLVLPRMRVLRAAFYLFVVGLALAEACGLLGLFLGGPFRDELFLLGVLGIAQYVPLFVRALQEPKPQGFFPNN